MAIERITGVIKSVLTISQSRVDRLVADYRRLESVFNALGTQVPYEPEQIVEIARQNGKLSEEQIQEYIERTRQEPQE